MMLANTPRVVLLRDLRDEISHNYGVGRTIVAVDGIGGSGTAEFADGLAEVFREQGRAAFRASIDDFHRPRTERYRRGDSDPHGFYEDSFDYSLFRRVLIEPYRLGGSAGFQLVGFDERRDQTAQSAWVTAPRDAVPSCAACGTIRSGSTCPTARPTAGCTRRWGWMPIPRLPRTRATWAGKTCMRPKATRARAPRPSWTTPTLRIHAACFSTAADSRRTAASTGPRAGRGAGYGRILAGLIEE